VRNPRHPGQVPLRHLSQSSLSAHELAECGQHRIVRHGTSYSIHHHHGLGLGVQIDHRATHSAADARLLVPAERQTSPVAGLRTSVRAPATASRHSPPINIWRGVERKPEAAAPGAAERAVAFIEGNPWKDQILKEALAGTDRTDGPTGRGDYGSFRKSVKLI